MNNLKQILLSKINRLNEFIDEENKKLVDFGPVEVLLNIRDAKVGIQAFQSVIQYIDTVQPTETILNQYEM